MTHPAIVILFFILGSPLAAFLVQCGLTGRGYFKARWPFVLVYYSLLIGLTVAARFSHSIGWLAVYSSLTGPFIAFWLLFARLKQP